MIKAYWLKFKAINFVICQPRQPLTLTECTTEEKFGGNGSKTFDQNWADVFKMAYDKVSCLHFSRKVFDIFQALLY